MNTLAPFRAFVSYCHADRAFAAWLQRRLETYRLPRRLAGQVEPLPGQAPGRIGPVFRDRPDLSAAEDLSAAVRDAIARSSALVVVASPDAARSVWVTREIELFRETHPEAPVLVALARGEPREALPESLRHDDKEPLCADFRKQGDGKRLAFLKIVAGLTHLPLDALVQRDSQRRVRRVTAVTGAAGVLLLILALLLVMALQSRREADRQRIEAERQRSGAEGLVEYMLTDLRDRLKGVGRPDVMAAVNARALNYYTAQGDLSRFSDESLERRARVLDALGDDDQRMGKLDQALASFTEASRTTATLLAKKPNDADRIFAHAQSEYYVGLIRELRGDRASATRHWRNYRAQADALARAEPGSVRSFSERAYSEGGLCQLDNDDRFDLDAAEAHCRAAIGYAEAALAKSGGSPKLVVDLANRHGWLARVQIAKGDARAALESRGIEGGLMDRLLERDPRNVDYTVRRTWSDIGKSDAFLLLGEPRRAAEVLRERIERTRAVFGEKSPDEQILETEFRLQLFLAKALIRLGEGEEAEHALARADALQAMLAASSPEAGARAGKIRTAILGEKQGAGK
jgi:tetratricopeptide (TPR) repeat protein